MKVGVVGSRKGVDRERVQRFLHSLHRKYPDAIVVSGGAKGVDAWAEEEWMSLGGRVISFRVICPQPGMFQAEELGLSPSGKGYHRLHEPSFADRRSCLLFRNLLIVEKSDRLVSFMSVLPSPGTMFTREVAERWQKIPVTKM